MFVEERQDFFWMPSEVVVTIVESACPQSKSIPYPCFPGLTLYRLTAPTACYAAEYETGMAILAQGQKRVTLGRSTYVCDESTVLLTSVDVPLGNEVVAASEDVPLLALPLRLDMTIVREILDREEFKHRDGSPQARPTAIGQTGSTCCSPVFVLWICWMLRPTYRFSAV